MRFIELMAARNRSLASRLRSKDSRAVLRGAVGKAFLFWKQLAGRLPYRTSEFDKAMRHLITVPKDVVEKEMAEEAEEVRARTPAVMLRCD